MTSFGLALGCGDNGGAGTDSGSSTMGPTTLQPTLTSVTTTEDTSPPTTSDTVGTTDELTSTPTGPGTTESGTESATEPDATTANVDPSTTTTTTDGTTEPESTSTEGTPCEEQMVTVKPIVPNVMLVLDKSGSMLTKWDHDADVATAEVTRWSSLYSVVKQIVTDFNETFNFGANLFPSTAALTEYKPTACPVNAEVEIPVAPANADAILGGIPAQNDGTLKGGTPTAAGLTAALTHLKTLDPSVPRLIMLITDGAANCGAAAKNNTELFEVYDAAVPTIVDGAFKNDGIPTYVVGIATINMTTSNDPDGNPNGINPYEKLNELAVLGGKPQDGNEKFYNANNQIQLGEALNKIVKDAQSCVLPLGSEPAFPNETQVEVGGVNIPKVTDCATEAGWVYTNPMGPYDAVELCGTACDTLKLSGQADVEYFCEAG